ncbi:response regulator transcription factor [Paucibacter sp. PLA-PC-4]|uniref:response regulator n=1 Tax=Paucibacter sp. PLA-PC-4 TaxID=2993655 RepID=UPI002248B1CC|nr:response regulator transcription factor [Paucibacter sp. PLA-PC-4]MCX2862925.1 response regulator transcription factor [Paucibacter sp. PLA-PC-4]
MRVLLVEDDAALAEAMSAYLECKGFAVDRVASLAAARAALPLAPWHAVLLDLHLPDGDGLELIPAIRHRAPALPIVVLTARDQVSDRIRGLDAGADDYLVKPFDPDELLARLRAVERRGRGGADSALVQAGALQIDLSRMAVCRDGEPVTLTAKEWSLLRVLALRLDRIHLKSALVEALYGFDDEVGSNTVEVFIHNLRRKLGTDSIQTVRGLGYRLSGGTR